METKLLAMDYADDKCIHQLFEEQVHRTPDKVALAFQDRRFTYDELNTRANQVAHYLRGVGVEPETVVAICLNRSLEMAVGILGILKAGAAWLPLDPREAKERQQLRLNNVAPQVLLTQQDLLGALPEHRAQTVLLDRDWAAICEHSGSNLVNVAAPTNCSYIMPTSGSTGPPKEVIITHANLSHYVHAMSKPLDIIADDVYLHTASITFSSSVRQLMVAIIHGAKLVIAATEDIMDPIKLFVLIKREKVTIIDLVPSYWRGCINALSEIEPAERKSLLNNELRLILTTGESLMSDLPKKWTMEFGHHAKLINMYGQTETAGTVMVYPIAQNGQSECNIVPIGKPIGSNKVYVLDAHGPVAVDAAGELYISGPSLGRGYLNEPKQTSETFVPDSHSAEPGARLYKTGDLARYLPNGNLEYLGRVDHQIKIRGFRVEAAEIEARLLEHPNVGEAVVIAREVGPDEKQLVAYVVAPSTTKPTVTELRVFLKPNLPDYMIPTAFVFLESLPRTSSGKLDRRSLPAPGETGCPTEETIVAPRTPTEKMLAQSLGQVLGMEHLSIWDNFFDLGLHSLLMVRFRSKLEKNLRRSVPLGMLFEWPTIGDLANALTLPENCLPEVDLVPIQRRASKQPFFMVHGDYAYRHFARHLDPEQPVHGIVSLLNESVARYPDVENRAAHYIKALRSCQPRGPYFLGGHSAGGLIVFEMAQQLRRKGEKVALLALFEPAVPGISPSRSAHLSLMSKIRRHKANLFGTDAREKAKYVLNWLRGQMQRKICNPWKSFVSAIYRLVCVWYRLFNKPLPLHLEKFYTEELLFGKMRQSTRNYRPVAYPGHVVYFKAESSGCEDAVTFWQRLALGGMEVHEVPGDHVTLLQEPYVGELFPKLNAILARAQRGQLLDSDVT